LRVLLLLLGLSIALQSEQAQTHDLIAFTSHEIDRILAHGAWPQPATNDPSNRVSGNAEAIVLGERLFFSPRLSGTGGVLCASCHEPWRGYSDGRSRGFGVESVDRNTQSVVNVRLNRRFGWDGANDNLWAQSIRPLLERREMRSSAARVAALMRGDPDLSLLYEKAFGALPPVNDEALLVDVGKALAAYQETLDSGRTPFDDFRDALGRGDLEAAARYPARAQRGLRVFIGKGNCAGCHAGPNFSDGAFHRSGILSILENGEEDTGRQGGIGKLLASRYNLLGPFNDDPLRATALGTRQASTERDVASAFRTPSLRQATLTAPYMHDGSLRTLCDVMLRHPTSDLSGVSAVSQSRPVNLTPEESRDLLVFLETLTEAEAGSRRFPGDNSSECQ
jgi:cytochrome c peroxidase